MTAAVLAVALLSAAAASARSLGRAINVSCTGQAALVAAINSANSAGGGTINLPAGCHIELFTADNGENGLPVITTPIVVNGNHATIDGTGSVRVFEVDGPGGKLWLRDVRITGGSADDGGGIANFGGSVRLNSSQVIGNTATDAGGGIASATFDPSSPARLVLIDSDVNGNSQTSNDSTTALGGGGIANLDGSAVLLRSDVLRNTAQGFVGGGIANGDYLGTGGSSTMTLDYTCVNGNSAPNAGGGGIQNLLGSVTLYGSQVDNNTSLNGGGISSGSAGTSGTAKLRIHDSQVNGNTATAGGGGEGPPVAAGGIANGSMTWIDHSQIERNNAPHGIGGGIVNHGRMIVKSSQVSGNTAAAGGFSGSGAGILNSEGPPGTTPANLTLVWTRVIHNTAGSGGYGGGIANGVPLPAGPPPLVGGTVSLWHTLVAGNFAGHGGGIFSNGGTVKLHAGSKVTANAVDNCEPTSLPCGP